MDAVQLRRLLADLVVVAALLTGTTLLVAALEGPVGIDSAATVYLLAVVAVAAKLGVTAAIATAVGAFLLYDLLFVPPYLTLTVSDAREWLALLLFLVVGVVVAWLAGQLRQRARDASMRESEANALYQVSRILATRVDLGSVLSELETILAQASGSDRVAVVLAPVGSARSASDGPPPTWAIGGRGVLRRTPVDRDAAWVRLHESLMTRRGDGDAIAWKVPIEASGRGLGAVWLLRARRGGPPDRATTRLLAVAADQLAQAADHERTAAEARDAEVARRSDALKSTILDWVSHDLRTPLASIRAAAGTLLDPEIELSPEDRRASAAAIDHEAEHLARVVSNLLDVSRVQGGALTPALEVYEVDDLIDQTLGRLGRRLDDHPVTRADAPDLPPVRVDAVLFDQVLANLVENACKYAPSGAPIRIGTVRADRMVRLTVEDGGPGVPPAALAHLFDKFYRVRTSREGSRPGSGLGLAVVRGLVEAMGGTTRARRSALGGLAIDISLPVVSLVDDQAEGVDLGAPARAVEA